MAQDPYITLGVSRSATDKEIRSAYRKLAKELHPDRNPDDAAAEERFKQVSAAFNILGDEEKRARFDRGEIDASGQERPAYSRQYAGHEHPFGGGDPGGFGDIFGDLFGARGGPRPDFQRRGQDTRYRLDVTFLEAALGAKKRIILPEGGTLDLNVPAGVVDGQVLRLKGKGGAGIGRGGPGDALIEITLLDHEYFEREDNDILLDLPISLDEAILGGKVEVPTISGRVSLNIPEGASGGQVLRLRGKGIVNERLGKKGDQRVRLRIVMPPQSDAELTEFIEAWREKNAYDPRKDAF